MYYVIYCIIAFNIEEYIYIYNLVLGQLQFLDPAKMVPRTSPWVNVAETGRLLLKVDQCPGFTAMLWDVFSRCEGWLLPHINLAQKKCIFENRLNAIWNSRDINSHTLTRAQKVCWLKSERNDRLICYPECPRRAVSPLHTPALSPEVPPHCLYTLHLHVIAITRARQNIGSPGRRASRGPGAAIAPPLFLVFHCGSWEGLSESQKRMIYWPLCD